MVTRTRGGDGNLKRSTASREPFTWPKRKPKIAEVLKTRRWSWMTVQECTPRQRRDLITMLQTNTGHTWCSHSIKNVAILWDDHKWELVRAFQAEMDAGIRKRYTAMVTLRRRRTDELFIFCSAHLSTGKDSPRAGRLRAGQARKMHEFLDRMKLASSCERVLIGADLNSASMPPNGPRGVLSAAGYRSLFELFPTEAIVNGTADTHKGFHPESTHHNAKRIDDVLSADLTIIRPEIVATNNGSDHRFIEVGARS